MSLPEKLGELLSSESIGLVSLGLIASYLLFKSLKPKIQVNQSNAIKVSPVSPNFNWEKDEPLRSYPFKDKEYKLTMGIRYIDPQEWLLVENTYLRWIEEKTKIVTNNNPKYPKGKDLNRSTMFDTPEADNAIREYYDIVVKYMCDKYPMYFEQHSSNQVHNKITDEYIPAFAGAVNPRELMHYLVRTIEEDFIILLKDPTKKDDKHGDEYYFKGGVFAFAAGFDPWNKFNKPLTSIHEPIPGYEEKMKLSMNKFFARIKPGEFVTRSNFSIQTHDKFYVDDSNKGYHLTPEQLKTPIPYESLDFEKQVHYRSERQVLTKLPRSGAIVFTIRTYLHPLSEFKDQPKETRQRLIGAINGFPPDIAIYKNSVQWGEAVKRYLGEE